MYTVYLTPQFERDVKRLVRKNSRLRNKIQNVVLLLAINPKASSLGNHKLSGSSVWSVSVTRDTRILYSIHRDTIMCLKIGTYDEVY